MRIIRIFLSCRPGSAYFQLPQLTGGSETFPEQDDTGLHLIEKTKQEARLRLGYNF